MYLIQKKGKLNKAYRGFSIGFSFLLIFAFLGAFIAIPTIAIFTVGLAFPKYIANDQIFSKITADLLKIIHIILGATCFLLCILGIILFAFREALFSFVFIGVGFIGMLVSLMLRVLSLYVRKAAILKEEADATL